MDAANSLQSVCDVFISRVHDHVLPTSCVKHSYENVMLFCANVLLNNFLMHVAITIRCLQNLSCFKALVGNFISDCVS